MRASGCRLAIIVLLCLSWFPGLAQAGNLTKQQFADQRRFAYNNSMFVLYHEMAHLLFDQLNLPVLGREEDAADHLATWTLLNKSTPRARRALADAVRGWFLSGIAYDSGGAEDDYAAPHLLDKQRAYQIICLMVGQDKSSFGAIAKRYHLSLNRQDSCHWDYDMVDRSLKGLLSRRSGRSGQNNAVTISYDVAGASLVGAADAFKSSGVFDQVADELRQHYSLRTPVQLNARSCGEANAFYDPDNVEIIFCYELMQDYMDIYAANMPTAAEAPRKTGGTKNKQHR